MKATNRMRVGAALALAAFLVGVGLHTDAKSGTRTMSVAVRADHPDASRPLHTGTKSTFSVDGVPLIVDEEAVIYT